MEYEEKCEEGKKLKNEGVEKYKAGDYAGAREKWDEACKYLDRFIKKYADYEKEGCDL
jgi:TolA-binding protein